eukprot:4755331-Amphidinium_carterae.1
MVPAGIPLPDKGCDKKSDIMPCLFLCVRFGALACLEPSTLCDAPSHSTRHATWCTPLRAP